MFASVLTKTNLFAVHLGQEKLPLSSILKANKYRDANGKYTSKDKAVYQSNKLMDGINALSEHVSGKGENFPAAYLESKDGKKDIADIATAYFKYKKHTKASGEFNAAEVNDFTNAAFESKEVETLINAKLKGSLNSKLAWEKIYQKKSLKSLEEEGPELLNAALAATGKANDKATAKFNQKMEFWKNQHNDNGGDPELFKEKAFEMSKAVMDGKITALINEPAISPKPSLADANASPTTEPKWKQMMKEEDDYANSDAGKLAAVALGQIKEADSDTTPKWKTPAPGDNASINGLILNEKLGVQYYKAMAQAGQNKKDPAVVAAYEEWQKSKDFLKSNSPQLDIGKLSSQQKQLAQQELNKPKPLTPEQQAAVAKKSALEKMPTQLQTAAYVAHTLAQTNPDSPAYQQAAEHLSNMQKKAAGLGMEFGEGDDLMQAGIKKAKADLKSQEEMKKLLGDPKATLKYYDDNADSFQSVQYDGTLAVAKFKELHKSYAAGLTESEKSALLYYAGSGYTSQNKNAVAGTEVGGLSTAFKKAKLGANIKLRRNMPQKWFWQSFGFKEDEFQTLTPEQAKSIVGKAYTEKAYSSTSKDLSFNAAFSGTAAKSGAIAMRIRAHKDIRGIDLNTSLGTSESEAEVVLDKGVTYIIRGVKKRAAGTGKIKWEIEMDAIGHV